MGDRIQKDRIMRRFMYFALPVCLLTLHAIASDQKVKALSALPEDFSFNGTWDCTGSFRNQKLHRATFTGAPILGSKWLELTEQDVEPATGYLAKYLIGYDSEHNHLVEFDANNFGAAVYTSAYGWQNHVLTMTSPVSDDTKAPYAANRFLYAITGTDTFTVDWQISKTASLNWTPADHLSCKQRLHG
jgi:hypothetical protein